MKGQEKTGPLPEEELHFRPEKNEATTINFQLYLGQFGKINQILMRGGFDITMWHQLVIRRMVSQNFFWVQRG